MRKIASKMPTPETHRLVRRALPLGNRNDLVWHIVEGATRWKVYCTRWETPDAMEHADVEDGRPRRICQKCIDKLDVHATALSDLEESVVNSHAKWDDIARGFVDEY